MAISTISNKIFFIVFIFLLSVIKSYGQSITNYAFSTATTPSYSSIGGVPIALIGNLDEGYQNDLPIGFDFWYMGERSTTFSVSTNGWMVLGQTVVNATPGNNLKDGALRNVIAPLWDDLAIFGTGTNPGIRYSTVGAEGARVLTVQWTDMEWNKTSTSRISFQVKFFEGTGEIRFVYTNGTGTGSPTSPNASIGISGPNSGQFASMTRTTTSPAPTISNAEETTTIATKPANNTNYQFSSTVPSPTNLTFTATGANYLTLNWADVATDNVGYVIYRSTNATTGFSQIGAMLGANATNYSDMGLAQLTTYYYKVFAVRESLSDPLSGNSNTIISCLETLPTGAVANYKLNGNANDAMGLNAGTFRGAGAAFTSDRFGIASKAYDLNGTNNFMSTTTQYTAPQAFTISTWFKTDISYNKAGVLIGFSLSQSDASNTHYQNDRHLYMNKDGKIYFGIYGGSEKKISTPSTYKDGKWHQVTGVSSSSGMALYVDGVKVASNTSSGADSYLGYWRVGHMRIKTYSYLDVTGGESAYFKGALDDVLIYHKALSDAEAKALYPATLTANSTGPVCAGYPFNLTGTTSFVGATYQWTGPNGYASSVQNPTGIELNNSTVGIYTVSVTKAGGCTTTAATRVSFKDSDPGLWAGKKDVSWSNVNNWCAGVLPTTAVNVTIPMSGPTFNPTLTTVGLADNIAIESTRSLTISGSGDLQIAGTITNAGTITALNGKVTMNGTTAQVIPASVFASNTIKDLTANNAAGVTLNGTLRLTGVLAPAAGIFQTNGNLTLASSATSTANVATIPSDASVRGAVKVERFMQGGAINQYRTYRMLSSPVYDNSASFINSNVEGNRSAKFSQLIDDIIVSSPVGAAGGFDVTHNNQAGAWTYASGFNVITNINTAVNAGKGMYVYFRGNRDDFEVKTNAPYTNPENTIIDFDGVLNQQDVTVSLPNGTSFIGNPYASTIDWDSPNWGADKVNVNDGVWIWRPATKSYTTYIGGVGGNGGTRYIASGQSFFVRTESAGTGSIKFKESIKASIEQSSAWLMSTTDQVNVNFSDGMMLQSYTSPRSILRILMKPLVGYGEDEAVVVFNQGSSADFNGEDALHIDGEVVNITTLAGTKKLAINFHSPVTESLAIPLHVNAAATGSYIFTFNVDEYYAHHTLVLQDRYLNIDVPLTPDLIYSFNVDKTKTASFGANRFSISAVAPTVLPVNLKHFTANKQNNGVLLNWKTMSETNMKHFQIHKAGADGSYVKLGEVAARGNGDYTLLDSEPHLGLNYYKLMLIDLNGSEKEAGALSVLYELNERKGITVYPNPALEQFVVKIPNLPTGTFEVEIFDLTGQKITSLTASAKQLAQGLEISASQMSAGVYLVRVKSLKNGEIIAVEKLVKQ